MFYVYSMTLFFLIGLFVGRAKPRLPWLWLVLLPSVTCILYMMVGFWLYPEPRPEPGVTFSELFPIFFIPPNFIAVVLGYLLARQVFARKKVD